MMDSNAYWNLIKAHISQLKSYLEYKNEVATKARKTNSNATQIAITSKNISTLKTIIIAIRNSCDRIPTDVKEIIIQQI